MQKYSLIDKEYLLGQKEEDVRLFFFVISELAQTVIFPTTSQKHSKRIDQCIVVFDVGDVSLMSTYFDLKPIIKISNEVMNNYYPETLHSLYIVNAGFFFRGVWNLAKVMLDKATQDKIHILSDNGFSKLNKVMRTEDIPQFLGGKCRKKLWEFPGIFNKKYFETFERGEFIHKENYEELRIFFETDEKYLPPPTPSPPKKIVGEGYNFNTCENIEDDKDIATKKEIKNISKHKASTVLKSLKPFKL